MNRPNPRAALRTFIVERRTAAGMGIALVVLVFVAIQSYRIMGELRDETEWILRSEKVLDQVHAVRTTLLQAESELRGFAITRDPEYLRIHEIARDSIGRSLQRLIGFTADDTVVVQWAMHLKPVLDRRFKLLDQTREAVSGSGSEQGFAIVRTRAGLHLTNEILAALRMIEQSQTAVLEARRVASEQMVNEALVALLAGTTFGFLVFIGLFVLLNRQIAARALAEQRSKESEQRILGFLEIVPAGIFVLTSTGRPYFANAAAQRLLGGGIDETVSPTELATRYRAFIAGTQTPYPNDRIPVVAALRGEQTTVIDIEIERDGVRIPLIVTGAPLYDASGRIEYALAAFLDATEQRLASQRLEESERRFRQIIESASDIIYRTDENGYFTFVNAIGLRIFNYTEEDVKSMRFTSMVRPDMAEHVRRFYLRQALAKEPSTYLEFPAITASGRQIMLGQNVTLLRDGDSILGFQAVARDITEERRAQQALARREQQLDTVIATVDEGITFSDERGVFEIFNRKMVDLTGYTMEEVNASADFSQLISISPEEHQAGLDRLKEVVERGNVSDVETTIRTKSGDIRTLLVSTSLVLQGHRRMFLSVYRDITERRRQLVQLQEATEAAQSAARAKAEFLATMSHEIRTPMNAVIGMTDILLRTELSTEQADYLDTIRISGETLLTIINDILDFSKIESGQLRIEEHPFDLVECIEHVYDLLAFKAGDKNLDLLYSMEPSLPRSVVGDVTRVRQILLNLVGNAVKFTPRGQILTTVTGNRVAENLIELRFEVRDTGIGIPEEALGELFTAFTQVDSSTTRRFGGTGLGLAISKRLVELMGGAISVTSALGHGSTFTFTIRVQSAGASPTLYLRSRIDALAGKRVFLVDDNTLNLEILRSQCALWGMYPASTTHPEEVLEWLRRGDRFDLGLLDMQMPEMDGVELARAIRGLRTPDELPLILLTSLGEKQDIPDGEKLFSALVSKPIKHSHLQELLASTVTGRKISGVRPVRIDDGAPLATHLPLRILVAEDNPVNQKLIMRILRTLGYEARLVGNGREAVEAAQASPFDIVLMDINMPEMDGIEATRLILGASSADSRPSILALTAGVLKEDKDRCAEAGMVDFLSKPFHMHEIQAALERWGAEVHAKSGTASRTAEESIFTRLRQLSEETDGGFVLGLVRDYLSHGDRRVQELSSLLGEGNSGSLRHAAHALKGGALNMGARALAQLAEQLQNAAENGESDSFADLVAKIESQWQQTRVDFQSYLGTPSSK